MLPDHAKFPLREQTLRTAPHYFRKTFSLATAPPAATLYLAGPRSARVWINGVQAAEFSRDIDQPLGAHVFSVEIGSLLRAGRNTIAIEAVRGRATANGESNDLMSQQAYGEVLVAKILPAESASTPPDPAVPALLISDTSWKSSATAAEGWQRPDFDDGSWRPVESLGPIEGNPDFFQWSADAGLYDWPGYLGMSPSLKTYSVAASGITHVYAGGGSFNHLEDLRSTSNDAGFTVTLPASGVNLADPPHLLLDFGREIAGRLYVESACDCTEEISASYGESEGEALSNEQFLGVNPIRIGPHQTARGPKSAFRYVFIQFLGSTGPVGSSSGRLAFRVLRAEGIAYPVHYRGSFESSDPLLNRIWESGAFPTHLCMHDNVWDAPKRDRGRWAGDLVIEGNVISDVFGDRAAIEDTLAHLAANTRGGARDVNGIPGYTAAWVEGLAGLYQHTGDLYFVQKQSANLHNSLLRMERGLNADGRFASTNQGWFFVDWSPGLTGRTPEAEFGTAMEYVSAFHAAVPLLRALGDDVAARHYEQFAQGLAAALRRQAGDSAQSAHEASEFGPRWQINALAVLSGVAPPAEDTAIWNTVLSHVKQDTWSDQIISPYFNFFVLQAMAQMGHRDRALAWIRQYWGGMLAEGATSFWEAYDLRWPKNNPHRSLEADGTSGYFISLAHGWSSGPTAWLEEQVLGIRPTAPGFRTVEIRPDLLDLAWARGAMPTPNGEIRIDLKQKGGGMSIALDLPSGEEAHVLVPVAAASSTVLVNGRPHSASRSVEAARREIVLDQPGHYVIENR